MNRAIYGRSGRSRLNRFIRNLRYLWGLHPSCHEFCLGLLSYLLSVLSLPNITLTTTIIDDEHAAPGQLHFVASRDIAQPVVVHVGNEEEAAMQRVVEQAPLVLDKAAQKLAVVQEAEACPDYHVRRGDDYAW
ncbi:hypothetical protein EDB19DRAFT_1840728 [Suillus lakei]|nr:hypothetical protein EDB19DRAFT_1840728 [Suillus lakei]